MKIIDLRSDTITLPTQEMRDAMAQAEVGDDVYGEDPSINRLEALAARMMGKEVALFTPSGTMSNLIATLTHTQPGDEIILGSDSHIFINEVGGAARLGGVVTHTVPNDEDGQMNIKDIEAAIRTKNIHFPPSTLVCLENTHNRCGGSVLSVAYTAAVAELAHRCGLRVHLDGARIFNAAIALGVPAAELARSADSISFCISKGLSAPVGSLLCSSGDFITRARKWRKMLGGGMRQAGVLAAAGIVALNTMVSRLADDHANAKRLAEGLAQIPGVMINPAKVMTNIVMLELPETIPAPKFIEKLALNGVKVSYPGEQRVRAVTHRMVGIADIDEALARIRTTLSGL